MAKLSRLEEHVLLEGPKLQGSYDPDSYLGMYEEGLTFKEHDTVSNFGKWVHENGLAYGHGNLQERYAEYLAFKKRGRNTK